MEIRYHINLGNYVTEKSFNSAYNKKVILDDKLKVISSEVELMGYFPYKPFDDNDKKRVKDQYKKELEESMEELICKINKQVTDTINILCENNNIESINLYPYNKGEFTIYTSIINSK